MPVIASLAVSCMQGDTVESGTSELPIPAFLCSCLLFFALCNLHVKLHHVDLDTAYIPAATNAPCACPGIHGYGYISKTRSQGSGRPRAGDRKLVSIYFVASDSGVIVHAVPASNGDQGHPSLSQWSPAVLATLAQNRGCPWPDKRAESYHSQGGPRQCNLLHCVRGMHVDSTMQPTFSFALPQGPDFQYLVHKVQHLAFGSSC